jgi:RNA polymerase sigma-70 factor (ECF subfamily)
VELDFAGRDHVVLSLQAAGPVGVMSEPHPFEQFVRDYQDMVYSTAVRLLAQPAEAEDIAQEVFLRAYRHFDQLHNNPAAGGWLKAVATRLALNHLTRYRSRWRFFSEFPKNEDSADEPGPLDFPDPTDARSTSDRADLQELVHRALLSLPDGQRVPLVLYHLEGFSYEEIARQLGISLAKVKTDIHRGRENLRRKLRLSLGPDGE